MPFRARPLFHFFFHIRRKAAHLFVKNKKKMHICIRLIFEKPNKHYYQNKLSMRKTKVSINTERLHTSSEILRAIAHPLRMKILEFIDRNEEINVNKIYNTLNLEQSITSQHLRILRQAGLVNTQRDGKYIHYSIDYEKLNDAVGAIRSFLEKQEN